jgi:hypothetical protein
VDFKNMARTVRVGVTNLVRKTTPKTQRNKKKNQFVQNTYYITGQVEDTQEEQLGKFK